MAELDFSKIMRDQAAKAMNAYVYKGRTLRHWCEAIEEADARLEQRLRRGEGGTMEPLIDIHHGDIQMNFDSDVLKAVQSYGIDVDAPRLIRALNGAQSFFSDGYEAAIRREGRVNSESGEICNVELQEKLNRAVEAMTALAMDTDSTLPCTFCRWNSEDMGCELDGSQYDDDGDCHFIWIGEESKKEGKKGE